MNGSSRQYYIVLYTSDRLARTRVIFWSLKVTWVLETWLQLQLLETNIKQDWQHILRAHVATDIWYPAWCIFTSATFKLEAFLSFKAASKVPFPVHAFVMNQERSWISNEKLFAHNCTHETVSIKGKLSLLHHNMKSSSFRDLSFNYFWCSLINDNGPKQHSAIQLSSDFDFPHHNLTLTLE